LSIHKPYSLGKSERLKSRKQIDQLFDKGNKITLFPFRILYQQEEVGGILKAGFTVSSKSFARAVDRNRIKRLMRESYRIQKKGLEEVVLKNDCSLRLFFIYTGREMPGHEEISTSFRKLTDKLLKVLNEKDSANS
jgi:ribonuclease P protein component